MSWIVVNWHKCWLTELVDCLFGEKEESNPLCIESRCIESRSSWTIQLLIDRNGWLLGEEGEKNPFASGWEVVNWHNHWLIGRNGWLLGEGERNLPFGLSFDTIIDWQNWLSVARGRRRNPLYIKLRSSQLMQSLFDSNVVRICVTEEGSSMEVSQQFFSWCHHWLTSLLQQVVRFFQSYIDSNQIWLIAGFAGSDISHFISCW